MLLLASLIISIQPSPPLVVLATHELPSPDENVYLTKPIETWKAQAETQGFVVTEDGQRNVVFVRHKDLYNLSAMDEMIDGISALEACVRSGSNTLTLGSLAGNSRRGLQRFLSNSLVGREAGALLSNGGTQVYISVEVNVAVSDGKREVRFGLPVPSEPPPSSFFNAEPTADETKAWDSETRRSLELHPYADRLIFSFSTTNRPSVEKAEAAQLFAERLRELLDSQFRRYTMAQGALRSAMLGDMALPLEGQSVAALDERTQRFLKDVFTKNAAAYGFESELQMQAFLADARVRQVDCQVLASVGVLRNGQQLAFATNTSFARNPPR